jgi:hypothetical protein
MPGVWPKKVRTRFISKGIPTLTVKNTARGDKKVAMIRRRRITANIVRLMPLLFYSTAESMPNLCQ